MHRSFFCATAIGISLVSGSGGHSDGVTLVRGGKSSYVIVVADDASLSEMRAARELQLHIEQISGARLSIQSDREPMPQHAILLGKNRHTDALGVKFEIGRLGPEGFELKTVGSHLVIVGSRMRGTMYGCSAFLEELGVRWFTPTVTHVPKRRTIRIPVLDDVEIPGFEYREPFFTEAQDKEWAARNRINGHATGLDETTGGKITYHPFVHSFDDLIPPAMFEMHPEYFPLIGGQRVKGREGKDYVQRCLTNPDVLRLSISRVKEWIKEVPGAMIYSVSQNDTGNWCECDQCKALTQQYGAHSGLYLWFVNQVAEAIESEHPDKLIDTLAYQFTEPPPTGIAPRRNVRIRLCPISCCEAHPYEKCSAAPNVAFVSRLKAWAKLTDTLYIWHYNTNFAHYLMPFPDFDEFPAEAKLYKNFGVKGIFFQGAYAPGGGGSDAELRSYVMAKLLWNPDADSDALVTEWMKGVYGKAWKPMRQWFDLLHEKVRNPDLHFFIYDSPKVGYLSDDVLATGDLLFDRAAKLATGDATASDYLAKSRLWLRYVKIMRHPVDGTEFQRFMTDVRKIGITQLREGQSLEAWEKAYQESAAKKQ